MFGFRLEGMRRCRKEGGRYNSIFVRCVLLFFLSFRLGSFCVRIVSYSYGKVLRFPYSEKINFAALTTAKMR